MEHRRPRSPSRPHDTPRRARATVLHDTPQKARARQPRGTPWGVTARRPDGTPPRGMARRLHGTPRRATARRARGMTRRATGRVVMTDWWAAVAWVAWRARWPQVGRFPHRPLTRPDVVAPDGWRSSGGRAGGEAPTCTAVLHGEVEPERQASFRESAAAARRGEKSSGQRASS